eukprot:5742714-Amphidinium_carterae.1
MWKKEVTSMRFVTPSVNIMKKIAGPVAIRKAPIVNEMSALFTECIAATHIISAVAGTYATDTLIETDFNPDGKHFAAHVLVADLKLESKETLKRSYPLKYTIRDDKGNTQTETAVFTASSVEVVCIVNTAQ